MGGGGGSPSKKVAQNELKHILVLEFLRYDHFLGGEGGSEKLTGQQTSKQARLQTSGHHSDQISRSALRDGATKNKKKKYVTYWRRVRRWCPWWRTRPQPGRSRWGCGDRRRTKPRWSAGAPTQRRWSGCGSWRSRCPTESRTFRSMGRCTLQNIKESSKRPVFQPLIMPNVTVGRTGFNNSLSSEGAPIID